MILPNNIRNINNKNTIKINHNLTIIIKSYKIFIYKIKLKNHHNKFSLIHKVMKTIHNLNLKSINKIPIY